MLFNSFIFAVFFPIVVGLYWILPLRAQNLMLLAASYVFYGYWDWRFLSLIAISTIVDYFTGLKIQAENDKGEKASKKLKKRWLIVSMVTNLGLLGFFKYFNFFTDSMTDLLSNFGIQNPDMFYLDIILPVGISFYTFQTMSYTIDIYRGEMKPTRRFFDFALYVSFFPQLVAGPIERAKALLPRILNKRKFNKVQFYEGVHLIFWGLFKKVYVADNLAPMVDQLYTSSDPTTFHVMVATWAFYVQVYCDFSGYSDIARGCAKCLGIELMLNFNFPLIATNPSDRWRRWHISLSTWLRDYLYIPLGGNRKGSFMNYRNLLITMFLGGLWHGAAYSYVIWGVWEGIFLIGHRLMRPIFKGTEFITKYIPYRIRHVFRVVVFFNLVCFGWIFFRSQSPGQIWDMLQTVFIWRGSIDLALLIPLVQYGGPMFMVEIIAYLSSKENPHLFQKIPLALRGAVYGVMFYLFAMHAASAQSFVYFQF
ncbi:MAG: MBOAT family protein [candidate division Zixibacteria bacterium]|nr:MBOAT family protein [candidate division Zixibacteria bacterium]